MTGQFRFAMYFLIIFVAIFGVLGLLGVFG